MKIAYLTNTKKFEIENKKIKQLSSNEVLVKVTNSAICGSDLHYFRHGGLGSKKSKFPLSLGHETCGVIADRNKSNFKNYTPVVIDPLNIKDCKNTKKISNCGNFICGSKMNLCPHLKYLGTFPEQGSFREYLVVDKSQITNISNQIDLKYASMVEPAGIAKYAINQIKINKESEKKILIIGSGAIGLLISYILKKEHNCEVTIMDKLEYRLKIAKNHFLSDRSILNKTINKKTIRSNCEKFDAIFDCVVSDETMDLSCVLIKKSGSLVLVGIPTTDYISFNPHKFRIKEIELYNVRRSNISFESMVELIINKKIPIKKLVTHSFKLDNIQRAFNFASIYKGQILRGIIES